MQSTASEHEIAFGREFVISKKELKKFTKRTNREGLINFFGHMTALVLAGYLVHLSLGSWFVVPAMLIYSALMAFLFAPCHECSHGTPFRSRWLNETVYWVVCLIYMVPPTFFRYAHATHHTYTQIRGKDPDMLPQNMTVWKYLVYVSAVGFWKRGLLWFLKHPFGQMDPGYSIPDSEVPRARREAQIILVLYAAVAIASIYFQSWFPVIFWVVPRLVGEPFMRWLRIAEHGECAENADLRENTRTTDTSRLIRFFFWNMPYHSEHHLAPMVPFHALGELHKHVKDKLYPVGESYPKVHEEVLANVSKKQGTSWGGAVASQ